MANQLFARKPLELLLEELHGENRLRRVLTELTYIGTLPAFVIVCAVGERPGLGAVAPIGEPSAADG